MNTERMREQLVGLWSNIETTRFKVDADARHQERYLALPAAQMNALLAAYSQTRAGTDADRRSAELIVDSVAAEFGDETWIGRGYNAGEALRDRIVAVLASQREAHANRCGAIAVACGDDKGATAVARECQRAIRAGSPA